MLFTGHIVAWYPAKSGRYLGQEFKYMDVVAESVDVHATRKLHERITFRAKNAMLDELVRQDCLEDGSIHSFDLFIDSSEQERTLEDKTKEKYPKNRMPELKGIGLPIAMSEEEKSE